MPVCFALREMQVAISLDEKPKTRDPLDLERVRNLKAHPRASLAVDRWDEDWSRLAWVHLTGAARIVLADATGNEGLLHKEFIALLREKYLPYRTMRLEQRPLIVMDIETVTRWGAVAERALGDPA